MIPIEQFRGKSKAGAYGDFMLETDWHVGRILDLLDREGLAENTLIVFTSDNGPETTWKERAKRFDHHSNGIYREGKRSIYEGGHRVPFLLRWPAMVKPGGTVSTPVCQTDLLATFVEMLGQRLPDAAGEDSFSFLAAMKDPNATRKRPPMIHHSAQGGFAIRDGKWKLVMEGKRTPRELYDLEDDPSETRNVISDHPQVAQRMGTSLTEIVLRGRSTEGEPQPNDTPWWSDLTWMEKF